MEDEHSGISITEANLKRLRDDWKIELHQTIAALRDELEMRIQAASQETNAGWFVRRIEALERENLSLRLERDRAIAQPGQGPNREAQAEEILKLKAQNEALERDLRQAHAKLDGFRQLLNGDPESVDSGLSLTPQPEVPRTDLDSQSDDGLSHNGSSDASQKANRSESICAPTALQSTEAQTIQTIPQTPSAEVNRNATSAASEANSQPKARGPKSGRAFNRAEAIFLAVKDWNRLNPSETYVINPGVLETVFHVHRQAAKDFFAAYQNELWDYHQEINVESPRWHNRGKDMERLKAFVDERLGIE